MKSTYLFIGLVSSPMILDFLFHKYWKSRWLRFSQIGVHHSTTAMKTYWGVPTLVSVLSLATMGLVILWHIVRPDYPVHWIGWVFASGMILMGLKDAITFTNNFFTIKNGPTIEAGLYQYETQILKKGGQLHTKCYICAKSGHKREMVLIGKPGFDYFVKYVYNDPSKRWSPTQGCFECGNCGRLVCLTHSDDSIVCDCGVCNWKEGTYAQLELDNEQNASGHDKLYRKSSKKYNIKQIDDLIYDNNIKKLDAYTKDMNVDTIFPQIGPIIDLAIAYERLEIVKYLIEKRKADINIPFTIGRSPLFHACNNGRSKEIIKYLLSNGADPNQHDDKGNYPLHALISNKKGEYSTEDKIEIIDAFVVAGFDINAYDMGATVLFFADDSDFEITQKLITVGADPNLPVIEAEKGIYPASTLLLGIYIVKKEYAKALELIKLGADPFIMGYGNRRSLDLLFDINDFENPFFQELMDYLKDKGTITSDCSQVIFGHFYSGWASFFLTQLKLNDLEIMECSFNRSDLVMEGKGISKSDIVVISESVKSEYSRLLRKYDHESRIILFISPKYFEDDESNQFDSNNITMLRLFLEAVSESNFEKSTTIFTSCFKALETDSYPAIKKISTLNKPPTDVWNDIMTLFNGQNISPLLSQYNDSKPEFDLFVSYRSYDSLLVRQIAEQLIAAGFKIWFAEYSIDATSRIDFQEMINQGIAKSKRILCFTNDDYNSSEYCQVEAFIIQQLKKSDQILEIELLDSNDQPSNSSLFGSECKRFSINKDKIEEIWATILQFLEQKYLPILNLQDSGMTKEEEKYQNLIFSFFIPSA